MVALWEQPAVAERAEDVVLSPGVLAFLSKFWRCDVPAQIETIYCATVMLRHELIGSHTTAVYKTFLATARPALNFAAAVIAQEIARHQSSPTARAADRLAFLSAIEEGRRL